MYNASKTHGWSLLLASRFVRPRTGILSYCLARGTTTLPSQIGPHPEQWGGGGALGFQVFPTTHSRSFRVPIQVLQPG